MVVCRTSLWSVFVVSGRCDNFFVDRHCRWLVSNKWPVVVNVVRWWLTFYVDNGGDWFFGVGWWGRVLNGAYV